MIGGNDVRLEGKVRFDPGKEGRRERLPRAIEALAVLLCWPLMLRYGYPLRRTGGGAGGRRSPAGEAPPAKAAPGRRPDDPPDDPDRDAGRRRWVCL